MTTVFMVFASVMVASGLVAFWQSLRNVFGGGPAETSAFGSQLPERVALETEKLTLLHSLKDIEFDRELGKISDNDFERLNKAYRRRAKKVLHLLDHDLEPYLVRAEREVAKTMGDKPEGPYRAGGVSRRDKARGKSHSKSKKRSRGIDCPGCGVKNDLDALHCKGCAARLAPIACEKCGTDNDPDAKFCKSCAGKLGGSEDE